MTIGATERKFEGAIEAWLLEHGGYVKGDPHAFDVALGLDPGELLAFIRATQEPAWRSLVPRHGGEAAAETNFLRRLAKELDERGTVDVLRHGVKDLGIEIRLAYFKPAHRLTPELVAAYEANRLVLVRQFLYEDSDRTIDLALYVNGIPVATAELKNPLTGQNVEDAIVQYRRDRDPKNLTLARRAVVHFAVDPELAAMTTKLAGAATQFLPFNRGSEDGGAGNRFNPDGHKTAYLWEQVWERDGWLDLLARFVQVERPEKGSAAERRAKTRIVFPRFHQWDAVRKLEAHAREHGAGQTYLVQHSAGSGKSNSIAWLAHRLSSLHDAADQPVYDKVVVITDRLVLDRQLQDTIYQFEHAHGVVVRIDKHSGQLADALAGEQARVIVTTLQKFPFVLDKVGELPARRYAVIVDEAHSSQTGEAAAELRRILSGGSEQERLELAEQEDAAEEAERGDSQDLLARSLEGRGRPQNLSFFAFTATPKAKTLELFGTPVDTYEGRRYVPFHLYSMRQAIEESFILDVLSNYTTYKTFFRIEKAIRDDPEYDPARAKRAIARFVTLHPYNLAQRAEIVVEHFRERTAKKIGGRAKAMVVTSSRLHAVRTKLAIDAYVAEKGYPDVHALVAFSGKVIDEGDEFTEPGMNGFPESQTAERFGSDDYQVLVVAEKFQTGFDQPLLHTMYVDKVLTGLNAVQTLSRLNRIHPQKSDTFVLDFRNELDEIQEAFRPYYERTEAVPTDPNLLYDTHRALWDFGVLREEEVEAGVQALLAVTETSGHGAVYAALDPARDRFSELDEEVQDAFRDVLTRFVNMYAFVSQIVSYVDRELERDYLYGRALLAYLPGQAAERLDLGSEVEMTHLKIAQTFEGSGSLEEGGGEVVAIFSGRGKEHEPETEHLSQIVEVINERYGLELGDADQLLFDQFEETWAADESLAARARTNTFENFRLVFDRTFIETVVKRMDQNEDIFKRILDDAEFQTTVLDYYAERLYERLRAEDDQLGLSPA
ncbi:MAG: type I restriction endonuclease [Gaiella sp.]|nr:type I restriction endonuclease [Gaiella sp.]